MLGDSPYGLQAGIYTQDLRKAFRAVAALDVGGIMVNDTSIFRVDHMPYGGNRMSGIGREGVRFADGGDDEPQVRRASISAERSRCECSVAGYSTLREDPAGSRPR